MRVMAMIISDQNNFFSIMNFQIEFKFSIHSKFDPGGRGFGQLPQN